MCLWCYFFEISKLLPNNFRHFRVLKKSFLSFLTYLRYPEGVKKVWGCFWLDRAFRTQIWVSLNRFYAPRLLSNSTYSTLILGSKLHYRKFQQAINKIQSYWFLYGSKTSMERRKVFEFWTLWKWLAQLKNRQKCLGIE